MTAPRRKQGNDLLPFLRWAGGKRWLTCSAPTIFPTEFGRYIEPFLGSAAVFFYLRPAGALLADSNRDLIVTYRAVRDRPRLVRRYLLEHQRRHSESHYYRIRETVPQSPYRRAARFIYLNRTCWNALYRVNRHGRFNVPMGDRDAVVLPTDDFAATSYALQDAEILHADFRDVISRAGANDFVFADPPYTVKHNDNGFLRYNERIFSWDDQVSLRDALVAAGLRGAHVLTTNADHPSVRQLYADAFRVVQLSRRSLIAATASNRVKTTELVMYNYPAH